MAYHATFHVIDTWKKSGKIWLKSPFYPKKKVIFEISKKKKCDFMCYTWYETIQHWHHWHCCWWQKTLDPRLVLQKITQYCPKNWASRTNSSHFVVSHTVKNWYLFTFLVGIYVRVLSKVGHATLQTFKYRQCKQIFSFKNLFILKVFKSFRLKRF